MTESTTVEPAASREVMDPRTGEVVDLRTADNDWLATFLAWIRELEAQAKAAKAQISAELHERMDKRASWTLPRGGGGAIRGQAPGAIDYDAERLEANLAGLVANEIIDEEAHRAAVEKVTELKVRKRGVTALLKLPDPRIKSAIEASEIPSTANRRITLEGGPEAG